MIYQMANDLAVNLQARKFPVHVFYGPERLTREGVSSMSIVVSHDRNRGDAVVPAAGALQNPKKFAERRLGCVAFLYVAASCDGARQNEHEHECDALVDALLVEIYKWCAAGRAGYPTIVESRYLSEDEIASLGAGDEYSAERLNGVVYVLRWTVARAILEKDYTGAARPVGTPAAVGTTAVRVSLNGTAYEDVVDGE